MLTYSRPSRLPAAGLATLAMLSGAGCDIEARIDSVNGSFERTVQVSGPVDLTVMTGAGDVTLMSGADGTVRIVGRIRARDSIMSGLSATERVERLEANPPVSQNGNVVRVGEIADDSLRRAVRVDYEITAPVSTRLRSRTGSGDQVIESIQGPVDITAGSGDLQVSAVAGPVTASTGSGDVYLRGVRGEANARTGSGDIEATNPAGSLRARTGSGDITVDGSPAGDWSIDAASGDVSLRIPHEARFTLDASSSSGRVRTTHAIEESGARAARRELRGLVGGGGPRVEVSTASGSVTID
jgi:hypothetical protein